MMKYLLSLIFALSLNAQANCGKCEQIIYEEGKLFKFEEVLDCLSEERFPDVNSCRDIFTYFLSTKRNLLKDFHLDLDQMKSAFEPFRNLGNRRSQAKFTNKSFQEWLWSQEQPALEGLHKGLIRQIYSFRGILEQAKEQFSLSAKKYTFIDSTQIPIFDRLIRALTSMKELVLMTEMRKVAVERELSIEVELMSEDVRKEVASEFYLGGDATFEEREANIARIEQRFRELKEEQKALRRKEK